MRSASILTRAAVALARAASSRSRFDDQDLDVLDGRGLLLQRDLHAGRAGVEQIDGLVGELPAGDVAGREPHRGGDGLVADDDLVGLLELGRRPRSMVMATPRSARRP
jgi:hypothetical protein